MRESIGALAVISGGLDSILAVRVMMDQGVEVTAVHFATPFFGHIPGPDGDEFCERLGKRYGIRAVAVDVTGPYIEMLARPNYGYGKNFNPCVDCKILLFSQAREMMEDYNARFLITGEVLGQRPMSQRRDTLRVIERDSETTGILLRPLTARLMKPTIPEIEGWVRREELYNFSGRSRKPQMELARNLGITGYPAPAGGCCLTDPIQADRIRRLYRIKERPDPREAKLIQIGRPFYLGDGVIFSVGRNEEENNRIQAMAIAGDLFVKLVDIPGPLGLIIGRPSDEEVTRAMSVIAYFSKARSMSTVKVGAGDVPESYHTIKEVVPADERDIERVKF